MSLLDRNSDLSLADYLDQKKNTLLHKACFKNLTGIALAILEKARSQMNTEELKAFINHRNEEDGFTAIHFCSFKGNLRLIKELEAEHANIKEKNNFGINVLHVAA